LYLNIPSDFFVVVVRGEGGSISLTENGLVTRFTGQEDSTTGDITGTVVQNGEEGGSFHLFKPTSQVN
jgi:hypothetical protein